MGLAGAIILSLLGNALLSAQSQAPGKPKAFDVTSVKISGRPTANGELTSRSKIEFTPTSIRMTNVTLRDCIQWAYHMRSYEVTGTGIIDRDRYDISAKTSGPVTVDDLRLMPQTLLADRFKLVLHRETKRLSVFDLIVDKGGPKLPPAKADAEAAPVHASESLPLVREGSFVFLNASMADFAVKLSQIRGVGIPVIDKTRIKGVYDIVLKGAADAVRQEDGAPITEFVRQIGLKMVAAKEDVEIIVVDSASTPSQN